ncbi:RICIN domain-containing protein [Streptomyces sp. HUAS TT7]|uniref:RICIN domain-containing protein n=1 Tax=Streptomyces sp. HUAS TT7 TaxID=3447507 RepID=UPI003F659665
MKLMPGKKSLVRVMGLVAAAPGIIGIVAGPAYADRPHVYVQQSATGHCLTFQNGGIFAGSCDNGLANDFAEHDLGNGYFQYEATQQPGTCLGMNPDNNDTVGAWPCSAGTQSTWWVDKRSGGIGAKFWNQYAEDAGRAEQCLDAGNDGILRTSGCNEGGYQRWSARAR